MLFFKTPDVFHFQRTLTQIHLLRSITNGDSPALPPAPAEQAGPASHGREPRSPETRCQPQAPPRLPRSPIRTRRRHRPAQSCSQGTLTSGSSILHRSEGAELGPLSITSCKASEMQHLTRGAQRCCGFQWHDQAWDLTTWLVVLGLRF